MKISTSILSSNNYNECIEKLNNTTTDYIHIEVMDNIFVPNYKLPIDEVNNLGLITKKPFDIHLMINDPISFINKLKINNIISITIHIEINKDIFSIIKVIKEKGYQVGLAIKPNTDLKELNKYLDYIDKVIIMSVEPGFGGQKFIENTIKRIKTVKELNKNILIEVDGGINNKNINNIKDIIDIAVVGSYITNQSDYQKAINELKN